MLSKLLGGSLVDTVGKVIDSVHTSEEEKGQIKILMFLDDTGQADLTWGSSTNFGYGHDLYPKIYDSITAEKGVMLVMPDYVSTGLVTLRNYKLWRVSF